MKWTEHRRYTIQLGESAPLGLAKPNISWKISRPVGCEKEPAQMINELVHIIHH
jgi:hypothetical protein